MKVRLPQIIETKAVNTLGKIKHMAKSSLNYVSNMFERAPETDIFIHSNKFEKSGISKAEEKFVKIINKVPVSGVGAKEQPILNIVQESMFNMLELTKGKSEPYKEILFAHAPNPQTLAAVYYPAKVLVINKSYLENIDGLINANTEVFRIMNWITKDKDGKYRIIELLRNPQSEKYEKLLNEYSPQWSLKEKFIFENLGTYYRNLATAAFNNPGKIIEKIFANEDNRKILREKGLYTKRNDVIPMKFFEEEYLKEIGEYCHLPEDTCLKPYAEMVFNHEYIHKWCFDNFSEEYLKELHSKPVKENWKNDKEIQETAKKISINAAEDPMEYIAEVGAGLAGGQKFDKEIMDLYDTLKGPKF